MVRWRFSCRSARGSAWEVAPEPSWRRPESVSAASATASAAAFSASADSLAAVSLISGTSLASRVAAERGRTSVKAFETPCRAEVTSLGITQNVLPGPLASSGSICRYW